VPVRGDELEGVDVVALVARGDEAGDDLVGAVAGQVVTQTLPDDGGVKRGAECLGRAITAAHVTYARPGLARDSS
jgi:hypothetical protein